MIHLIHEPLVIEFPVHQHVLDWNTETTAAIHPRNLSTTEQGLSTGTLDTPNTQMKSHPSGASLYTALTEISNTSILIIHAVMIIADPNFEASISRACLPCLPWPFLIL